MKMRYSILIVLLNFWCFSFSQQSEVSFIIKNFGVNVDGYFDRYQVEIEHDEKGTITKLKGTVFVNTISTGIEMRDEHLLEAEYFDALQYPEISIESTSVSPINNAQYKVMANLSIKGTKKPITFKGSLFEGASGSRFETEFELNRRDFNVGGGGFLGKMVKVKVIYYLEP